ncbi:CDT1-like protein b [Tripterygium wilfordii]|uniref:CDT1-like protein b n=1 Tax=Tripterygium wilfordii TaxID=458696 RepID=A0A7J7C963_TRIWF|nr:CDT1-like protein b [Tripterygium wilfordii]KAF5730397.1 CDT1-like protein b [Tripterygium wilfordii]
MDERECEKSRQSVLDFKCKKILPVVDKTASPSPSSLHKPGMAVKWNLETSITSQTPEKINEPLLSKHREGEVNLQNRYNIILELFDSISCSLRLLGLCKKPTTFQNICTQVEVLTKRKLSYRHLAQIKYILPEAMKIDKILLHDEKTLCMKQSLKITLLLDVIEGHDEPSDYVALRQVFASRLVDFCTTYPEACDIPEADLPEPYNKKSQTTTGDKADVIAEPIFPETISQRSQDTVPDRLTVDSLVESLPASVETQLLADPRHQHPIFTQYFSQKVVTKNDAFPLSSTASDGPDNQSSTGQLKGYPSLSFTADCETKQDHKSNQPKETPPTCSEPTVINSSVQQNYLQCSIHSSAHESPLQKSVASAGSLIIETPAQLTPKRSMPSCEDKHKTSTNDNKMASFMPAKRSLDFSTDKSVLDSVIDGYEDYKVVQSLHCNIVRQITTEEQSTKGHQTAVHQVEENFGWPAEDCNMSQSSVMVQQTAASLPDLVDLIYSIFQSVNCSSITKEELVHKILMNNIDIVDRKEVEEQIEMIEKLVPVWICRKQAPSGDILYNINTVLDLKSVQAKVISA